jgi:precorrin-8X/cobalt-precorrin-8 methylmutase
MVDWSARNGRACNKQDCIWIASGQATDVEPVCRSPASRTEATNWIEAYLLDVATTGTGRVLVCFDFGYAYPSGFAAQLPGANQSAAPWRRVWDYLAANVWDDVGTAPGLRRNNRSNRFAVADGLNAAMSTPAARGPFWCTAKPHAHPHVPQRQPPEPFRAADGRTIKRMRHADVAAKSDYPFRLYGTGSVGSQILVGVPRLHHLRTHPQLAAVSRVWPLETGWAPDIGPWDLGDVAVLHAEIYPSVREPLPDPVRDRGQVRAMWTWARDADATGELQPWFTLRDGLRGDATAEALARTEEGWILGV